MRPAACVAGTAILLAASAAGCASTARVVTVQPVESVAMFANPGMGWQTFHCFADGDANLQGLPSASAYFRLYWREIEPTEGGIDFVKLDDLLARAHRAGQKLALRVMCAGTDEATIHVPAWLRDRGCPGFEYRYEGKGPRRWVPDMDHPLFLDAHLRLIAALGRRYDGHPDLDVLDIGSVGLWGEWHMSGTGLALPRLETRRAIIEAWCRAFPRTPKVMLIADADGMREALRRGCGWRADCLGDLGGFSKTWNHMENFYPQQLAQTGAGDGWKQGPVAFESCWDMRKWTESGWDVGAILDYALYQHASYMNNKSMPLPAAARPQVEAFLRRVGYRLVLRKMSHPSAARRGASVDIDMEWENVGVAPPYIDARVAFRLRAVATQASHRSTTRTTVQGWLPGRHHVRESLLLPHDIPAGDYDLDVGVVEPGSGSPCIRLAIEGLVPDTWYSLSRLEVR